MSPESAPNWRGRGSCCFYVEVPKTEKALEPTVVIRLVG